VASFAAFIGVVWWAYSARRKDAFDAAARSVVDETDDAGNKGRGEGE
jgi:cbb3-type cytochrome oxidase subunit 3